MAAVRILIAEDNDPVAQGLEEQLNALGYEVVGIARSGVEVLRSCEQLRPDLVIVDLQLPEHGGAAVTKQIVERTPTAVVIMTAFADPESIRRAEDAGALAYLVKPVNPEEMPPAIDIALARFRELQGLRERVGDLQETIDSRKVLERAKGILMKRMNIGDAEAETRLRQRAKEKGVRVQDMAQAIVDSDALLS
ncbi:MAG TPA: response regulator [Herpetosiphonaceae bacterium]|nr:response regulator [Herpetosiphonaceae bacterium]